MSLSRPTTIDDDGTRTTGTVFNHAWWEDLFDRIDAALETLFSVDIYAETVSLERDENGPNIQITNTARPAYIEFYRSGFTEKGSIGALGSFEMNMCYNVDAYDGTHHFYNSAKNAFWLTLGNTGMTLQYAPAGATYDIWTTAGIMSFFASSTMLATSGDFGVLATNKIYLDGARAVPQDNPTFGDTYICESAANKFSLYTGGVERMTVDGVGAFVLNSNKSTAAYLSWQFNSTATNGGALSVLRSGVEKGYFGTSLSVVGGLSNDDVILKAANNLDIASGGVIRVYAGGSTEVGRWDGTSSLQIGGTTARATTPGTKRLDIFDGTAPVGTLANGISLYSTAGELRVMDAAGNATLLSPHDHTANWVFDCHNTVTGKHVRIEVEQLLKRLNAKFGEAAWFQELSTH